MQYCLKQKLFSILFSERGKKRTFIAVGTDSY